MLDAAFERTAELRDARNMAAQVGRNAVENYDFDAAEDAAAKEKFHWNAMNGALAILAIMLDGLGYDMKPTYPDSPSPCPFRAEAELEKWLNSRWARKRET
jgi:hypothetical protein